MGTAAESDDPRAELFESIGHPIRIKILQVLHDEPMGFADLKRAVGVESSGNMSYHLTKLRHLVRTAADGNYVLTDAGREALWSIGNISGTRTAQGAGWEVRKTRKYGNKVVATLLIVALLTFGVFAGLEQQQLNVQQEEITSLQQHIGLYVNPDHPNAMAQAASVVIGQLDFTSYYSGASASRLDSPSQALLDPAGNLWVVDSGNNRVLEFEPPFLSGMEASLVIGQRDLTSSSGEISSAGLALPAVPAFDRQGNLWVLDGGNRILEFIPPFANGMSASLVIGQPDFVSSNPSTTQSGFDTGSYKGSVIQSGFTTGIHGNMAFDPSGNLWVGDGGNDRILEFKPPFSNDMSASMLIGQWNYTARAIPGGFTFVRSLYLGFTINFDGHGNLWASYNERLMEFEPPFANGMQPTLEIGQPDFTDIAWVGGQNGLSGIIYKPGFDSAGNLWVPDDNTNRVLEFASAAPISSGGAGAVAPPSWGPGLFALLAGALVVSAMVLLVFLRTQGAGTKP